MFNKDIDRLFQEQFKDFEQSPHPKIWKGIEKELKTTPSVFYRFRWLGFAGSLLLVFGLWQIFTTPNSKIVKSNLDTKEFSQPNNHKEYKTQNNDHNTLVIDNNSIKIEPITKTNNNTVANTKIGVNAQPSNPKNTHLKNVSSPKNNTSVLKTISLKKNKTQIITASNKKNLHQIASTQTTQFKENVIPNLDQKNSHSKQKPLNKKQKIAYNTPMEIAKVIVPKNQLYLVDLSKIKIKLPLAKAVKVKERFNKWEIGTSFSPIYYSSFTQGSPLDNNIASSEQSSSNSYAYGLNVAYKLNKKWSVKTGLFKRNLAYKTADVGVVFQVITNNNIGKDNVSLHSMNDIETSSEDVTFIGDLKQELKYLEIPLEIKYQLLNKRIGVNLNGGFSTLFLNGNNVQLERSGTNFSLGKASNISNTCYSLNLGFDTSLHISDKWNYSISPTFKYHLNTFTGNDGGFKPYSIGFNTGLYYNF